MKTITILSLIIIIFTITGFTQESVEDAIRYYPLHTGNYWKYEEYYEDPLTFEYNYSYHSIEVIGDTLLNGKSYKILKEKNIPDKGGYSLDYERIDSTAANVYRYCETVMPAKEYLIDSLMSQIGNTCHASRGDCSCYSEYYQSTICENIEDSLVFSYRTVVKSYYNQSYIPGLIYALARDIGYLGGYACEYTCNGRNLVYARLNGKTYGNRVVNISDLSHQFPSEFDLLQNYPNPFNPVTHIPYSLPKAGYVEIMLYTVTGQRIATLVDGEKKAGNHLFTLDADQLASGVYICRMNAADHTKVMKMVLLK
jgi:hypothetical protein